MGLNHNDLNCATHFSAKYEHLLFCRNRRQYCAFLFACAGIVSAIVTNCVWRFFATRADARSPCNTTHYLNRLMVMNFQRPRRHGLSTQSTKKRRRRECDKNTGLVTPLKSKYRKVVLWQPSSIIDKTSVSRGVCDGATIDSPTKSSIKSFIRI